MLTHDNFVSNVRRGCEVIPFTADASALSFLPLSHVFERMLDYSYCYTRRDDRVRREGRQAGDELHEINPHCFGAVPRVYEKVTRGSWTRSTPEAPSRRRSSPGRCGVGASASPTRSSAKPLPAGARRCKAAIADALVFKKIRAALGTRFRFAVSGGAPLSAELAAFFVGAGCRLRGVRPDRDVAGHRRQRAGTLALGTVGKPMPGVEVQHRRRRRDPDARPARHEGLLQQARGDRARRSTPTAGSTPATSAGSTRTASSRSRTARRTSSSLAGGKKAAPQPIENALKQSPYIGLPVVIGDRQKFLAALIVPNFDKLKEWASRDGRSVRWDAIDADPEMRALFQHELDSYNRDRPHHEQIRAFALLPHELTVEDGSMTPTLKVKRRTSRLAITS